MALNLNHGTGIGRRNKNTGFVINLSNFLNHTNEVEITYFFRGNFKFYFKFFVFQNVYFNLNSSYQLARSEIDLNLISKLD